MKPPTEADPATLRSFADLAAELGFKSDQITDLQEFPGRPNAPTEHPRSRPALVTSGKGVHVKKRYRKQSTLEFLEDRQFLFVNHLHDERQEQGKSVTSFFVRKSVYLAFFGRPSAAYDIGQTDDPPQSSQQSSEHVIENYNGILSLYQQRGARSEPHARSNITEEGGAERAEGSIDVSMQDWLEDKNDWNKNGSSE
ncbi:hypothetical protein DL98DRAFT_655841 [Cadophora sp. DSE1049]|nr:hypothetical protein DL98DRAFT_655841 [Cadophora sp. DSE1049]